MSIVNTAKVQVGPQGARELRFSSLEEVIHEMERIADAERQGTLKTLGNWTTGQTFGHLASWIDYSYDGFPAALNPPWIIRFIVRLQKKKFLHGKMPRGVKIPGSPDGTYGTEPMALDRGVARLRSSLERLQREKPTKKSVLFGELTHEEWIACTLRHSELHMGYLRY